MEKYEIDSNHIKFNTCIIQLKSISYITYDGVKLFIFINGVEHYILEVECSEEEKDKFFNEYKEFIDIN